MNWAGFGFAHPWVLWSLCLLPILAILRGAKGASAAVIYSSLSPLRSVGVSPRRGVGGFLFALVLAAIFSGIIALARPQISETTSRTEASGIDIVLALDVSSSMLAEDISIGRDQANRLEAVKKVTEDFITARPNDRIGMVAFAAHPYLVSPLTLDHEWLLKNLARVQVGMVEDGTAIGSSIASAANRLKDRTESKSKIIVLLTDGDNNAGKVNPITAAEAASAMGIKIYTIGVGSKGIARIPTQDQFGRKVYAQIRSQVDEATLKKIAQIGHGSFYRATDSKSLQEIFKEIDKLEKTTAEVSTRTNSHDLYPWFTSAAGILAALHLLLNLTLFRRLP